MATMIERPRMSRDNAGLISMPITTRQGCRGVTCPAFAVCQGRCETRRSQDGQVVGGYPGGLAASA